MQKEGKTSRAFFRSPLGLIEIKADDEGIVSVLFSGGGKSEDKIANPFLKKCLLELEEYFAGRRRKFDLDLDFDGTVWQKKVWRELLKIPFGQTVSYSELAEKVGGKQLAHAVASSCAQNKLMLLVPCHRVIGADGRLKGYSGGFRHKKWLLDFEKK